MKFRFGIDKIIHIIAGLLIFFWFGLPLCVIVAAAKEGFDWWWHGRPDVYDFLLTIVIPVILFYANL